MSALAALLLMASSPSLKAEDIVKEALESFPPHTFRLEYSNSAKLRSLPNYANLRQHYLGPRLLELEQSLSRVGIKESDVDEIVLGWQAPQSKAANPKPDQSGKTEVPMELYGFAAGRFSAKDLAAGAAAQGLATTRAAGQKVYCLGPDAGSVCVVVLSDSLGAFGDRDSLDAMLQAREGKTQGLSSDARFTSLVKDVRSESPIWGVAVGEAVADWFRSWTPGQDTVQLDWSQAFNTVEDLAYSVNVGDKVRLDVKLDCANAPAAASLRQVLDGLKAFQQMAWQNQHPNRPNPFEEVQVDSTGSRVGFRLTTPYSAVGD